MTVRKVARTVYDILGTNYTMYLKRDIENSEWFIKIAKGSSVVGIIESSRDIQIGIDDIINIPIGEESKLQSNIEFDIMKLIA